jgi:hypothetical protein
MATLNQFINGIRSTYGSYFGMSESDYNRYIEIYGAPSIPRQDPYGAQMAAITKATRLYNEFGDWSLVAYAWTSGMSKAMEIQERFGGNIRAAQMEDERFRAGYQATNTLMGRVNSASNTLQSYSAPGPQVNVINYTIPQAPAYNAQGEVDAYVTAMSEQAQAEEEKRMDPKANSAAVAGSVLQSLSNMVRYGGSSGFDMSAQPSQQLEPTKVGQELNDERQ